MRLVYTETHREVRLGDRVSLRKAGPDPEAEHFVKMIEQPENPVSIGRVSVRRVNASDNDPDETYYPSDIGAEWIEREDRPPELEPYLDETLPIQAHAEAVGKLLREALDPTAAKAERLRAVSSARLRLYMISSLLMAEGS